MIDLDKYKAEPYEIEQSVLEALPVKDLLELIKCYHDQMKIHRSNIEKMQEIMNVGLGKE